MKRLKDRICDALEWLDAIVLDHWAGCAVLNRSIYLLWSDERQDYRVRLPSPTGRLYLWALDLPKYDPKEPGA